MSVTAVRPATPEIPQPGRVVQVRGATWAVTDVQEQGLSRSPQDETVAGLQHVVTLQALGEDNLGDELRVVWELEVGHNLAPDQGLPARISPSAMDDPDTLGALVDAVRWGAVTSADDKAYQSPFRSGANVESYQLEPLRRALQSPRTNLLLADDVGLGKTIEAGLVIQELLLRHRARTVVILCPPSLSSKWHEEMRDKFGLDFVIVNSERMAELRRSHGLDANPFRLFPRVIVSMAWLRSARAQRLLRDMYAQADDRSSARRFAFDMLVVDEAHHIAPASPTRPGGTSYAVDSLRTIYTRELARRCEHRLFLSATPHNGHTESFTALLEMIDDRRFTRGGTVDQEALKDVTVRRLKRDITSKNFRQRVIHPLPVTASADEQEHFAALDDILRRSKQLNGREGQGSDLVALLLKKRLLSSPVAFARTLASFAQLPVSRGLESSLFDDNDEVLRETLGSGQSDEEEGLAEHPEFLALRGRRGTNSLGAATAQHVDELVAWGMSYEARPNARLDELLAFLDAICRPDGSFNNERVVVFTEYADTLHWLREVLTSRGYGPRLAVIEGSTDQEARDLIREQFTAHPSEQPVRVLLATDSAGEGIDLQTHCHRLVNFDIPFNPARLEQRIGRIDRYGQTQAPEVYHFVPTDDSSTYSSDMAFLSTIARKVAFAVEDLGSMNAVIDHDVQEHYAPRAGRRRPTQDRQAELINTALAGDLTLNQQLTELERTFDEKQRDLHLTPANTRRVVETALALSRQNPLVAEVDELAGEVYRVPQLGEQWHKALEGLATRLDSRPRLITFDRHAVLESEDGGQRADLVAMHLGHPLVQRSARLLRNASLGASDLHGVTAVVLPELEGSCVAAVSRLVLVGRGGLRLHEEVFVAGIRVQGQAMAEDKVLALLDHALDPDGHQPVPAAALAHATQLWNVDGSRLQERLTAAVQRRASSRQQRVEKALAERESADLTRARHIFASFRRVLHESIREFETQDETMLPLAADEREQRVRDVNQMRSRLVSLGDEEAREVEAIRDRYTDVKPYVSTVALVLALSSTDAVQWGTLS